MTTKSISLFDRAIMTQAIADAFKKLNPPAQLRNPVMFVTLIGAILTFVQFFTSKEPLGYVLQIALWLLFTVIFANFAESVAEGRGKAQARALRASRRQLIAKRRTKSGELESIDASQLKKGDIVVVIADEQIPGDGEVIEGVASVDKYFHSRPSSAGSGYDAANSSGSNLGPTSQKLADAIKADVAAFREKNGLSAETPVPADAVTRSGSGLDPHISVANAELQAARVARVRRLPLTQVRALIAEHTAGRSLTLFGDPGVNVLRLNRALDNTSGESASRMTSQTLP